MRIYLLFITLFASFVWQANAQFLKTDLLAGYAVGNDLEKGQYAATSGVDIMKDQWNLSGNADNRAGDNPKIVAGLTYPGYNQLGGAIPLNNTTGNRISIYSIANDNTYNQTYYLSALVNLNTLPGNATDFLMFDTNFAGNAARGKLLAGKVSNKVQFMVAVDGDRNSSGIVSSTYDLETTHLIVLKLDLPNKTASLFVNPSITETEPTANATYTNAVASSMNSIRGVVVKQRTSIGGSIGSFRLADNWKDAISYQNSTALQLPEKDGEIVAQQYYDLSGLLVQNTKSGVFIRKSIYKDGLVDVRKVLLY